MSWRSTIAACMQPFFGAAVQFAHFVAHVILISAMKVVIEVAAGPTGLELAILEMTETVAIAVAAIRSFWMVERPSARPSKRRAKKPPSPVRRAGFV